MNKKAIGIIIIILAGIIIIGIIYIIFFYKFSPSQQGGVVEEQPATSNQPIKPVEQSIVSPSVNTTVKVAPIKKTEINQDDLARIALSFAERFGSFSNQSDYDNVRDLKIFMSSKMQIWADNYISQAQASRQQSTIYYGVTAKAVSTEVKQFNNESGQAEILVKTQKREATGTMVNSSVFYQDVIIRFIKEKGAWKIDSAIWQAK